MAEVTITRLGLHGDGIADGPIYVPRSLPGELVTGELDGQVLRDVKIVSPSDQRVSPPCRHFKACGGCQLQHASDQFVAEWKVDVVRKALEVHGLETDFRALHTSPPASRRRAGFAAKRTKKGATVGFYGRASDVIVDIPECRLLAPEVLAARQVAEELAMAGASRKAALAVLVTASRTGLDVSVSDGKDLDGPLRQQLARLCEQHRLARLSWGDEVIAMRAPPLQSFDGIDVSPPPGAFLQATTEGQECLIEAVKEIAAGSRQIVDLFAGCGTFGLPLSRQAEVHAVESDRSMLDALDAAWRHAQGLKRVTTEARDLFRRPLLADELAKADLVVLDPPRAGAEAQIATLADSNTPRIAYVSCNPVTFARDAAVLTAAGFTLDWIQVVDQFRWSAHVELAASFTASHMR